MGLLDAYAVAVHKPAIEIKVRWDDLTYLDETSRVLSAEGIESMDDLAMPQAREASIVLDNADGRYTAGNTASPIYAYTSRFGRAATVRGGYDVDTTGGWELVGTYVLRDLTTNEDDKTATVLLRDAIADYVDMHATLTPTAGLAYGSAAVLLLASARVPAASYVIDTLTGSAQFAYAVDALLLDELWQIALAEGGRLYLDENGILRLQSRVNRRAALRSPVATLRASEIAYRSAARRRAGRPNRVALTFEDRATATVAEPVFSIGSPIKVDAGATIANATLRPQYVGHYDPTTGDWVPGDPLPGSQYWDGSQWVTVPGNPQDAYDITMIFVPGLLYLTIKPDDMTRWKSNIPADMSSAVFTITANTAADGSGTAVTVTALGSVDEAPTAEGTVLDYWWTDPASGSGAIGFPPRTLIFWNTLTVPVYVRQLDVSAKPSRREASYQVVKVDEQATLENGGRVVERAIASAYLPDQATAALRAQEMLAVLTSSRAAFDIPDIDGAPFLRSGDAFTYIDDTGSVEVEYELQVLENRWTWTPDGGYSAALTTMPALGTAERPAALDIPPPAVEASTGTRTGPFRWGPDANALTWGTTTWG